MKRCAFLLISLNFFLSTAAAPCENLDSWAQAQLEKLLKAAEQGREQYHETFQQTEVDYFFRLRELPENLLKEFQEKESSGVPALFLEVGRILWPVALPENYDGCGFIPRADTSSPA